QEYVDRVAARFHPERIILFGSHAYGVPNEHSDVDLLVVMPDSGKPLHKSIQIVREVPYHGFACDLIVRDPGVLRWRIENNDWFLRDIVEKGVVLYEDQHERTGLEGGG